MSFYAQQAFICCNQRQDLACCNDYQATALLNYAKKCLKSLNGAGKKLARINQSSCLNRCGLGPVMVVYGNTASTQETWYTFNNEADMDEIIASHLIGGQIVTRLQLLDHQTTK